MAPCICALLQQASVASALKTGTQHQRRGQSSCSFATAGRGRASRHLRQGLARNLAQSRTVHAVAAAEVGKFIARTEIPAFIPRQDLMDQLIRWAYTEVQEESLGKFGLHVKVQRTVREGIPWGFVSSIMRDGATVTDISVSFDEESTHKYEWVGRKADGFPKLEGNAEEILGKHFVIRKADDNPIDDEVRGVIKLLCQEIQESINKYYAFGSCFVDDAT